MTLGLMCGQTGRDRAQGGHIGARALGREPRPPTGQGGRRRLRGPPLWAQPPRPPGHGHGRSGLGAAVPCASRARPAFHRGRFPCKTNVSLTHTWVPCEASPSGAGVSGDAETERGPPAMTLHPLGVCEPRLLHLGQPSRGFPCGPPHRVRCPEPPRGPCWTRRPCFRGHLQPHRVGLSSRGASWLWAPQL